VHLIIIYLAGVWIKDHVIRGFERVDRDAQETTLFKFFGRQIDLGLLRVVRALKSIRRRCVFSPSQQYNKYSSNVLTPPLAVRSNT